MCFTVIRFAQDHALPYQPLQVAPVLGCYPPPFVLGGLAGGLSDHPAQVRGQISKEIRVDQQGAAQVVMQPGQVRYFSMV